jgi:hypothetical protein
LNLSCMFEPLFDFFYFIDLDNSLIRVAPTSALFF